MKRLILLAVAFLVALNLALFAQQTQQTQRPQQKPAVAEQKKAVADTTKKAEEESKAKKGKKGIIFKVDLEFVSDFFIF